MMNTKELLANIENSNISVSIKGIALNASQIKQDYAFIALQGKKTHGADYIEKAIDNGCSVVIAENKNLECGVPCIKVNNLSKHLATIANRFYTKAKLVKLIGVTGTNGKTSVSFFISQILEKLQVKTGIIGTLGIKDYQDIVLNTTPDIFSIYKALDRYYKDKVEIVIIEVSSHALDQERLDGLFFQQAIFTNLTQDHLDYHKNIDNYKKAKAKLFVRDKTNFAIINKDDKHFDYFANVDKELDKDFFSIEQLKYYHPRNQGFLCMLDDFIFEVPLLGEFNLSNVMASIHSLIKLGYTKAQILPHISNIKAPSGRMEKITNHKIWIDYAHTPDALHCAIKSLALHYKNDKIKIVFGCGGDRDNSKRAKMGEIASNFANEIIITNDNPRNEDPAKIISDIKYGITDDSNITIITDRKLAIETAIKSLQEDECLLISGKGHESMQIIANKVFEFQDLQVVKNALMR